MTSICPPLLPECFQTYRRSHRLQELNKFFRGNGMVMPCSIWFLGKTTSATSKAQQAKYQVCLGLATGSYVVFYSRDTRDTEGCATIEITRAGLQHVNSCTQPMDLMIGQMSHFLRNPLHYPKEAVAPSSQISKPAGASYYNPVSSFAMSAYPVEVKVTPRTLPSEVRPSCCRRQPACPKQRDELQLLAGCISLLAPLSEFSCFGRRPGQF
jgi:hypothetical protein